MVAQDLAGRQVHPLQAVLGGQVESAAVGRQVERAGGRRGPEVERARRTAGGGEDDDLLRPAGDQRLAVGGEAQGGRLGDAEFDVVVDQAEAAGGAQVDRLGGREGEEAGDIGTERTIVVDDVEARRGDEGVGREEAGDAGQAAEIGAGEQQRAAVGGPGEAGGSLRGLGRRGGDVVGGVVPDEDLGAGGAGEPERDAGGVGRGGEADQAGPEVALDAHLAGSLEDDEVAVALAPDGIAPAVGDAEPRRGGRGG